MATMLLLAVMGGAAGMADWGFPEDRDVVVLTPVTHEELLRAFDEVLMYYFLPDCDHCINFEDGFHQLALNFKEGDRRLPFAKLDCRAHLEFCHRQALPTFPFLKLFVRGHALVYYGERRPGPLREFVERALARAPATVPLAQLEEALRAAAGLTMVFVGRRAKEGFHLLDLLSKQDHSAVFFHLEPVPGLAEHILFQPLEEPALEGRHIVFQALVPHLCPPATALEHLARCLEELRSPAVMELGPAVLDMMHTLPQRWMFLFAQHRESSVAADFARFARDNRQSMRFVLAAEDGPYPGLLPRFKAGLMVEPGQSLPQVRLADTAMMLEGATRYALEGTVSYTALRAFHRRVLDGSLSPALRSEEFEARPLGRLTALSGRSFERQLAAAQRDAVVLFHGELETDAASRELLETLEELVGNDENADVSFFALNADRNELRTFHSTERPLVLLFGRRDPTHPRVHAGPAAPDALQAFIDSRRTLLQTPVGAASLASDL